MTEARNWLIVWFATPADKPKRGKRRESVRPMRVRDIAELLMCSDRHVYNVIKRYNNAESMPHAVGRMRSSFGSRGRKKLLTDRQYTRLAEYLRDHDVRGLKVSLKDMQDYAYDTFGVRLSRATASRYRHEMLSH